MKKEIGSNFWFNRNENVKNKEINISCLKSSISDIAFLSTGRSAISYVLDHIKVSVGQKVALLPPFTCHTVIEPFLSAGYKVCYYRIKKNLMLNKDEFLEDVQNNNPSVILIHGYFGFNTLEPIRDVIEEIDTDNIAVIEDITQTVYSDFKHIETPYIVCSLRKWAALPDGGFATSSKKLFAYKPVIFDEKLQEAKLKAFHAKYLYMEKSNGIKDEFLKMYNEAEKILCEQEMIYSMSPISKKLQGNLDIDFLRSTRRNNYTILLNGLEKNRIVEPLYKTFPEDVTPLYFPIYVKRDRGELQSYLAKNDVYVPVVWPKPKYCEGMINEDAEWVYRHILAIPCDQRYGIDDMKRIIKLLNNYQDGETKKGWI